MIKLLTALSLLHPGVIIRVEFIDGIKILERAPLFSGPVLF
jgi:hypothetical protein